MMKKEKMMKKSVAILLVIAVLASMSGCTQTDGIPDAKVDLQNAAMVTPEYPAGVGFEDFDGRRAIRDANVVEDEFHAALNRFAYQTAAQVLLESDENQLYSPISLYYAAALATMGANGETQEELLNLLGVSDLETLAAQCGNSYRLLHTDNEISQLRIANSLWLDKEINEGEVQFKEDYLNSAKSDFYASVYDVDFSNPDTGVLMGQWIAEQTNGTLSYEFELNPVQIMSILNTIYFYDEWTDRFDAGKTEDDQFHLVNGETVNCDFMNARFGSHGFVDGEGFTRSFLALKEAGSMTFILPDEGVSIGELLVTPERIQSIFQEGERQNGEVIWQIPKFTYGSSMDLSEAMKTLGVNRAFESDADFSGMVEGTAFISDIQQNTHISIDENGVEASAYTEIAYAGAAMPEGRADMVLDRPFIFGIKSRYGDVLFIGVCMNPTQS
jgi:serpin B